MVRGNALWHRLGQRAAPQTDGLQQARQRLLERPGTARAWALTDTVASSPLGLVELPIRGGLKGGVTRHADADRHPQTVVSPVPWVAGDGGAQALACDMHLFPS